MELSTAIQPEAVLTEEEKRLLRATTVLHWRVSHAYFLMCGGLFLDAVYRDTNPELFQQVKDLVTKWEVVKHNRYRTIYRKV